MKQIYILHRYIRQYIHVSFIKSDQHIWKPDGQNLSIDIQTACLSLKVIVNALETCEVS